MARFFVRRVFELKSKRLLVLAGSIVDGVVEAGMEVCVPMNSSSSMTVRIHSIEFLRHLGGDDVCLCIQCPESEEAGLLAAFDVSGETLEILQPAKP
jgi:GTPase